MNWPRRIAILIVLVAACIASSGCLAMFGTKDTIRVETTPPGAEVWFKGRYLGTTPVVAKIDRRWLQEDMGLRNAVPFGVLELHLEGYQSIRRPYEFQVSMGRLLLSSLVSIPTLYMGMVYDALNGAHLGTPEELRHLHVRLYSTEGDPEEEDPGEP